MSLKPSCALPGCDKPPKDGRKICGMHAARFLRNGHYELTRRQNGTGSINSDGYVDTRDNGRRIYEHVLMAERALGKRLPAGAVVHHVDKDKSNNDCSNLVICASESYHRLLHLRTDALEASGHADWLKCWICKEYGPQVEYSRKEKRRQPQHIDCAKAYARNRYHKKVGRADA